jgi:hypothetical protein
VLASPKAELSHDNRYFALINEPGQLAIIDLLDNNKIVFKTPDEIVFTPCFTWSNISRSIAYILKNKPSEIISYNLDTKNQEKTELFDKPSAFTWLKRDERVIAATVNDSRLIIYDGTKKIPLDASGDTKISGDITSIFSTAEDDFMILGVNDGFLRNHLIYSRLNHLVKANISHPLAVNDKEAIVYLSSLNHNKVQILAQTLNFASRRILDSKSKGRFDDANSEDILLNSRNGKIPLLFWNKKALNRSVVLMLHGGPRLNYQKSWTPELELMLAHGIDLVQLNFHGSAGYGEAFANQKQLALHDVEETIKYLIETRHYKKVFLHAESSGSNLALQVTKNKNEQISGLIITGFSADLRFKGEFPKKTIVFQARYDYFCNPDCARTRLQEHWGQTNSDWLKEVEDEMHIPQSVEARSAVIGQIIKFITDP